MHEMSVATELIATILEVLEEEGNPKVKKVFLQVGSLSNIVPESLEFCYNIIKVDTVLKNSELVIQHVPVTGKCNSCGQEFEIEHMLFVCPRCQSGEVEVTRGQDLKITELEVEA